VAKCSKTYIKAKIVNTVDIKNYCSVKHSYINDSKQAIHIGFALNSKTDTVSFMGNSQMPEPDFLKKIYYKLHPKQLEADKKAYQQEQERLSKERAEKARIEQERYLESLKEYKCNLDNHYEQGRSEREDRYKAEKRYISMDSKELQKEIDILKSTNKSELLEASQRILTHKTTGIDVKGAEYNTKDFINKSSIIIPPQKNVAIGAGYHHSGWNSNHVYESSKYVPPLNDKEKIIPGYNLFFFDYGMRGSRGYNNRYDGLYNVKNPNSLYKLSLGSQPDYIGPECSWMIQHFYSLDKAYSKEYPWQYITTLDFCAGTQSARNHGFTLAIPNSDVSPEQFEKLRKYLTESGLVEELINSSMVNFDCTSSKKAIDKIIESTADYLNSQRNIKTSNIQKI